MQDNCIHDVHDNKPLLRFQFIYGKQSQAFFKGRVEVILEFTPNPVDGPIAKGFLVSRDSKNKKKVRAL